MKKIYLTFGALLSFSAVMAQNFELKPSSIENLNVSHAINLSDFASASSITIEGQEHLSFESAYDIVSMEVGAPAVPFFTESVIIPEKGAYIWVKPIVSEEIIEKRISHGTGVSVI